jgi:hypothetical protein
MDNQLKHADLTAVNKERPRRWRCQVEMWAEVKSIVEIGIVAMNVNHYNVYFNIAHADLTAVNK